MPQPIMLGNVERMSFSKVKDKIEKPNLIEVQTSSFNWFLEYGLKEAFRDISPIRDYTENLILEFIDYELEMDKVKYDIQECKDRDVTYAVPLKVLVRFLNTETGEVKEQKVFMGDFPMMTPKGTFIINGAERVIVSQLVRSPGAYYDMKFDKVGSKLFSATLIPNRGAWLEYETDSNDIIYVRIDRTRKIPATTLIRALGIETDEEIIELFGSSERLLKTIEKDTTKTQDDAVVEIYKKLRPGEPPNVDNAKSLLYLLLFDEKRYDLARVGRYKYNKKLGIKNRITDYISKDDILDPRTGELLVGENELITDEIAIKIQNAGINVVYVIGGNKDKPTEAKVVGNNFVDIKEYIKDKNLTVEGLVHYPTLLEILNKDIKKSEKIKEINENFKVECSKNVINNKLSPHNIIVDDVIASFSYILNLSDEVGFTDDIDHLGNRRIRSVGELLQNQFRIGLSRMERVIKERMTTNEVENMTPQSLINIRPVTAAIKEFFGSSQLSQFMDQNNPLAEITNLRRLSALGPGGLSRERAGFEVRDVHFSHYGRICPIETPEGPNIGLIGNLSIFARINKYGFIETPYVIVEKGKGKVTNEIQYLTADAEKDAVIITALEELDKKGFIKNETVIARQKANIKEFRREEVSLMEVSPQQMISVSTSLIPFIENDDANRALMGANMQKQAVPLIRTESPIIGTGMEYFSAKDSCAVNICEHDSVVEYVSSEKIILKRNKGKIKDEFDLLKFKRSNQGTCVNQKPLVYKGQKIKKGHIISDGPSTQEGEMALGKNLKVAFMTWNGYNYEDSILLSEELLRKDTLTSIHIEEYESEARDTKLGPEEITRDVPNVGEDALKDLDYDGIIRIGAEVEPGDILVGKVTPKGETDLTAEEKLLRAIFGEKAREVRDSSLRVPHGEAGVIVDVRVFKRKNGDELPPGVNILVRVYIAKKRKTNVGDKMSGRHGNKGVISKILPIEDMPFADDGTPVQVVLNPLGVPSRMNIGQVLEVHLGLAAEKLGWKVSTMAFDGANETQIADLLEEAGYPRSGKLRLRDGRTGEYFDNPVSVGYMYMLKLHHLVDDKIHARSTGPYSLVTQQPLGGKAQFGGQRFGEMEVWALEAYGAAYSLQEILTVKSDDIVGRVKAYEAIVKGENIPEPGIPESFKVLIKEFQSLALDITPIKEGKGEVEVKESVEIDDDEDSDIDLESEFSSTDSFQEEGYEYGLHIEEEEDDEEEDVEPVIGEENEMDDSDVLVDIEEDF